MPLTILVVDDDEPTRLAIHDYLELTGYSVVQAANGEEALKMLTVYQPQLLVTDIAMPELDGYELVRRMRQHPPFRLLPVIFLTARNKTQERILGYQLGCDAYLPKPFDLDELWAVVRNLLERSQLIQSALMHQQSLGSTPQMSLSESTELAVPAAALPFQLTDREQDVLTRLAEGLSNAQIGDFLHLSPRTIEKYVSSLLRKTETSNRAELVRYAIDHHLI